MAVQTTQFGRCLQELRRKADKSRYRLAQYTGLNEAYLLRLESGERRQPSRDVALMLALALASGSDQVSLYDVEELLLSAGYAPLRRRGQSHF
ncbi:MAG: helix-turn-helix transcriptional regulator [Dehalococcoidia bacterium]